MNKNKNLILSILGVLSVMLITGGVTYAFFTYTGEGTTDNAITTDTISFLYTETSSIGNGITLEDTFPMTDEEGKVLKKQGEYFDFKITSDTMTDVTIPYEVTARKLNDSTLDESAIRIYLTKVEGTTEKEILLNNYNNLKQTTNMDKSKYTEKTIYTGIVPANSSNYEQNFRLRIWLDENIDFSSGDYNGNTFGLTVNVYSNAKVTTNTDLYKAYSIGEEITLIDGSKWHVLEESGKTEENVVLLSDYNLNSDGTYNDKCGRDIDGNYYCSPMMFDSKDINIYNQNSTSNIGYFIKNVYAKRINKILPEAINITLPTVEQIANADGQTFNGAPLGLSNNWIYSTEYWTKSVSTLYDNCLWYIYHEGGLYGGIGPTASTAIGARPTITVPKKYIVETLDSTTELSIGTAVEAVDGSKWHVLEASSSDSKYVTLLSDYNLNSDGTYNTECGLNINSIYACSPMPFDSNNTNIYDENDSNNIGYFIKNTYAPLVKKSLLETKNITLPEVEQILVADNQIFNGDYMTLNSPWLITMNFWTKTSYEGYSDRVWIVSGGGAFINNIYRHVYSYLSDTSNTWGTRPTITTLKTNLMAK